MLGGSQVIRAQGARVEGCTLLQDFSETSLAAAARIGPTLSYSGGDNGTYFDSAGVLQTSGKDAARFDHNPLTLTPLGLLIEEARTNLALQSENLVSPWVAETDLQIIQNVSLAPDGTLSMDRINDNKFGGTTALKQVHTISAGLETYTYSVYVQKFVQDEFPSFVIDMTGGTRNLTAFQLDTQTGAIINVQNTGGTNAKVAVEELEDHWRIAITGTNVNGNTTLETKIFPAVTRTFGTIEGSALGGINVWGHQLEQGSFATSYIKTTTAAVTRTSDLVSMSDVSWFNAAEGTFFVEADDGGTPPGAFARLTELNDGADSDRLIMMMDNGKPRIFVDDGGVTQATLKATNSIVRGTAFKVAGAYKLNDIAVTSEGTTVNTDTMATMPDETNFNFTIGTDRAAAIAFWNGHIAQVKYWQSRLPDAMLQALTA